MRRAAVALAASLLGACALPFRPAPSPLTAASFGVALDTFRVRAIDQRTRHAFGYAGAGPWAIHVLDHQLGGCRSAAAVKGGRSAIGRAKTSDLLRGLDSARDVVGGVNADFFLFDPPGVPANALVVRGRVVTPPTPRPVFAVDSAGQPHIVVLSVAEGRTFAVDDTALAHVSLVPFHPVEAVGGRPMLVRDSSVVSEVDTEGQPGFATGRHPRTAIGIADRGRRLLLVTVDGRQAGYSAGMTLRELANVMLALGARDALNLDGGGSTTMVVEDPGTRTLEVVNRPSDPAGERPVGDALAIVRACVRS